MDNSAREHIGGLDGLRGLAVAVVVAFHFWPSFLPGGFVGVSLFFALSGYLITSTVLRERDRTDGFSIRKFYVRRIRRLLPASLMTIAAVIVFWRAMGWFTVEIAHQSVTAVAQVANWAQLLGGHAYGQDTDASPLLHFWSLAIEEQFYWVFPLLAALFASRRNFGLALGALFAGTVAVTAWNAGNTVVVYYSTFTRTGEILAGAILAVALHRRLVSTTGVRVAGFVGAAGVVALLAVSRFTSLDTVAYGQGGLLIVGVLSAVTVAAVSRARVVSRVLDVAPMAWLGLRSYGIYLFHWPIVVALRQLHVGAAGAVAVPLTLAVTMLSYHFVEMPVRQRRLFVHRPSIAAMTALATVLVAATVVPAAGAAPSAGSIDFGRAQQLAELNEATSTNRMSTTSTSTAVAVRAGGAPAVSPTPASDESQQPTTTVPAPVRVAIFGDSKALVLALAGGSYVDPNVQFASGWVDLGCPLGRGGRLRTYTREGRGSDVSAKCDWTERFPLSLQASGPLDVGVVYYGTWDVVQRNVAALGGWRSMDNLDYQDWLYQEMLAATDVLHASGVRVVAWATVTPSPKYGHADRFDVYNAMLARLPIDRPGVAAVIDLAGWFAAQPDMSTLLPDLVHVTYEPAGGTGLQVYQRFLGPELVRLGRAAP